MKKYCSTLLAVLLMLVVTSCKKSFLDKVPSDFISEADVFANINNAEAFLNNAYTAIPSWNYGTGNSYVTAAMTDEAMQRWSDGAILFNTGAWNPSNFSPLGDDWTNAYAKIRICNLFLENYNLIPEDPSVPTRKTRLKGESLMLRAFYHFVLFRGWGKIPLMDSPLTPAENGDAVFLPRSEYPVVVAFIEKDLNEAMEYLPPVLDAGLWGRANKTICQAIKSRLFLYYASSLFNPTSDISRWQKASLTSKEALDAALAQGYTLEPVYANTFLKYANTECIWGRSIGTGAVSGIDQVMQPLGYSGWSNCGPIQAFVDAFQMKNGLGIKDAGSGWDPKHPYKNRDPRFYTTVLYPGATWKSRTVNIYGTDKDNATQPGTNYWWRKYMTPGLTLSSSAGAVTKSFSIFRTAELMLNYAEAENEVNGATGNVYTAINQIRARAGMPNIVAGLTKDQMREAIRLERRIELSFEGHRFWDVRRWKIADQVDNGPVYGVGYTLSTTNATDTTFNYFVAQTRVFNATKHYLLPVPQLEMDKLTGKNSEFKQTEGW